MMRLLPLLALLACSEPTEEDPDSQGASQGAEDTDDSAGTAVDDTAGNTDSGDSDAALIPLRMTFTDGVTGVGIAGAEICTLVPESDEPCPTTDANGLLETTWEVSEFTNVLNRLAHPDYMTTLYVGRYDQDVHDGWMNTLKTSDAVEIGYWSLTPSIVTVYLATGGLSLDAGQGLAAYWLLSADGSSLDGARVVLENDSGEPVGQAFYHGADSSTIDSDLTATSTAGSVGFVNVPPGEYTLRVFHDTLTCMPFFAFASDIPNVTTVPVEADSYTIGSLFCYAG